MKRNSLLRICVLIGFVFALAAMPATASAQSHSGTRSFLQDWAPPGAEDQVTITAEGYGAFGQVVETLPADFTYIRVSLDDSQVEVNGQEVRFSLLGETEFIYHVRAPTTPGTYTFSGFVLNINRDQATITGDTNVRVGAPPTPAPTSTPTPVPQATATPEPTVTPTPEPEATPTPEPTPEPTATPEPTPTPAPTPTPEPTPTPAATPTPTIIVIVPEEPPTPTPTPEPTPTATATPRPSGGSGGIPGIIWFIPVVAAIGLILAIASYLRTRS